MDDKEQNVDIFYDTDSLLTPEPLDDTVIDVASSFRIGLDKTQQDKVELFDGDLVAPDGADFQSCSISLLKTILGAGKIV